MKHSDYITKLENNAAYQTALEELKAHFLLGDAIIRARTQKGLSQAELAELVGTKQANISRIESALGNPTLKLINKLANVLEIQIQFNVISATNSFRAIPTPRIPVYNWPKNSVEIKSASTQSVGNLT